MHPAALEESELIKFCESRRQRRSGPGGQHRNKVETAVVITHKPTGIKAEANERRSQEENRQQAVFRLRVNLALDVREARRLSEYVPSETWRKRCRGERIAINPSHLEFPAMLAEALDVLASADMDVKLAAESLGCSSSQLIKFLQNEPRAMARLNAHRRAAGKSVFH